MGQGGIEAQMPSSEPQPPCVIAPADSSCLDRMVEIEAQSFAVPWTRGMLARELENRVSTVLVAREGSAQGLILGYMVFWTVLDELHVLDVAVDPSLRRRGVGQALLEQCAAQGRAGGATVVMLEVRRSNVAARGLYRKVGFREVGERPRYYSNDQEDAILMEWKL